MTASQTGVRRYLNDGDLLADSREYVLATDYDALLASHAALAKALTKLVAQFEDLGEDMPLVSSGCIECTAGTVPNHLNTGLCGYHEARRVLRQSGERK